MLEELQVEGRTRCDPSAVAENPGHRCEAGAHGGRGRGGIQSYVKIMKDKIILLSSNVETNMETIVH